MYFYKIFMSVLLVAASLFGMNSSPKEGCRKIKKNHSQLSTIDLRLEGISCELNERIYLEGNAFSGCYLSGISVTDEKGKPLQLCKSKRNMHERIVDFNLGKEGKGYIVLSCLGWDGDTQKSPWAEHGSRVCSIKSQSKVKLWFHFSQTENEVDIKAESPIISIANTPKRKAGELESPGEIIISKYNQTFSLKRVKREINIDHDKIIIIDDD